MHSHAERRNDLMLTSLESADDSKPLAKLSGFQVFLSAAQPALQVLRGMLRVVAQQSLRRIPRHPV